MGKKIFVFVLLVLSLCVPAFCFGQTEDSGNASSPASATELESAQEDSTPVSAMELENEEDNLEAKKYVNEKYAVTISGPKGWSMNVVEEQEGANESLVNFSKYPLNSKVSPNPTIFLTATDISTLSITDAKEYMEKTKDYFPPNSEILSKPSAIKVNNLDGAIVLYVMHSGGVNRKALQYSFIKGGYLFTISMITRDYIFEAHRKFLEDSLNTFKIKE